MIIVMKPNAEESAVKKIITKIEEKGLHTHLSQGEEVLIIGVVGDKSKLDTNAICALPVSYTHLFTVQYFHCQSCHISISQ